MNNKIETIDGMQAVRKSEVSGFYVYEEVMKEFLFFVDKLTLAVLLKIELKCDMNGNEGFIAQIIYNSFETN